MQHSKKQNGLHEYKIFFTVNGKIYTIASATFGTGQGEYSTEQKAIDAVKRSATAKIRVIEELNWDSIEKIAIG